VACSTTVAPADAPLAIERERAEDAVVQGPGVTYGKGCLPQNRVAMTLFHNRFMRLRVLGRYTLWQLLVFLSVVVLIGGLCYYEHKRATWAVTREHRTVEEIGAVTAYVFEYCLAMLFLPLNHNPNGLFPYLLGSSWEYLLDMHKWLGDACLFFVTVHSVFALLKPWVYSHDIHRVIKCILYPINLCGVIALFVMWALRILSIGWIRRRYRYEIFYACHVVLTAATIVLLSFHVRHPLYLWEVLAVPAALWVIDIGWRLWKGFHSGRARVISKVTLHKSGCTILELDAVHGPSFSFEPGQWGLLCLPSVSRLEHHPFALLASTLSPPASDSEAGAAAGAAAPLASGSSHHKTIKVLVKTLGDWTKRLEATPLAALRRSSAFLQGPIGRIPIDMEAYENVVLVGAGCAIAPAIGHAQRLFLWRRARAADASLAHVQGGATVPLAGAKPRRIWLVLTVVYRDMYVQFADDLTAFAGNEAFRVLCYESGPYGALFTPETHKVSPEEEAMVPVPVTLGMPDLHAIFQNIRKECSGCVAAVVAGPPPVEEAAVRASKAAGFTLHIEPNSW